jgi:hypothetical protein
MRKTIYSLPDLAEIMLACNRRYLDFLSSIDDPAPGIKNVKKLSRPVQENGRSHRGFNLFHGEDEAVFRTLAQGAAQGFGLRNHTLRELLGKARAKYRGY